MSIKSKVFAAAASLALISGVGTAGALSAATANAATPSCGGSCVDLFVQTFSTHHNPQFVLDVYKQRQQVGNPIILFRTSNTDPAEDWTVSEQGTVHDFFLAGLVSAAVNLHYGGGATIPGNCGTVTVPAPCTYPNDQAFEFEYAPYGADTGLCMGTGTTAVNYTTVSLQPCGVSSKTVWIDDSADVITKGHFVPLINGSDTNFSHPYVLTYPQDAYPTDKPRAQLITLGLTGYSTGTIFDRQQWSADLGVLP
jgi:hypothetical protein